MSKFIITITTRNSNKLIFAINIIEVKPTVIILAIAETLDNLIIKKLNLVSPNKLKLLPGSGVDLDYFIPQEKKYSYGKTFLYLGRLIYEKDVCNLRLT